MSRDSSDVVIVMLYLTALTGIFVLYAAATGRFP